MIAQREGSEKGILDEDTAIGNVKKTTAYENKDYVSSSPHAAYDSTRNMRVMAHHTENRDALIHEHQK